MDSVLVILTSIFLISIWVVLYDMSRFTVTHMTVSDKRIKQPTRIVVLSDLHNKCYGKDNEKLLAAIREQKPDAIITAGDVVTAHPKEGLHIAENFLSELTKDYPVYYGMGNHEHRMQLYPQTYGTMWEEYKTFLDTLENFILLDNQTVPLRVCPKNSSDKKTHPASCGNTLEDTGIFISGSKIDREYYKRFGIVDMDSDYMNTILGSVEEQAYSVLIAHNPDYFPKYAYWGADLVLAGHVHGGIVQVPLWKRGCASPNIRLFPWYDAGLFSLKKRAESCESESHRLWPRGERHKKDFRVSYEKQAFEIENDAQNTYMYLNRGLGMHTIPIRLFNPAELVVIDFRPSK